MKARLVEGNDIFTMNQGFGLAVPPTKNFTKRPDIVITHWRLCRVNLDNIAKLNVALILHYCSESVDEATKKYG